MRLYSLQEAVEASNASLARSVAEYEDGKRLLEEQMRARRERYSRLFGLPLKAPVGRKGDRRHYSRCSWVCTVHDVLQRSLTKMLIFLPISGEYLHNSSLKYLGFLGAGILTGRVQGYLLVEYSGGSGGNLSSCRCPW